MIDLKVLVSGNSLWKSLYCRVTLLNLTPQFICFIIWFYFNLLNISDELNYYNNQLRRITKHNLVQCKHIISSRKNIYRTWAWLSPKLTILPFHCHWSIDIHLFGNGLHFNFTGVVMFIAFILFNCINSCHFTKYWSTKQLLVGNYIK